MDHYLQAVDIKMLTYDLHGGELLQPVIRKQYIASVDRFNMNNCITLNLNLNIQIIPEQVRVAVSLYNIKICHDSHAIC